MDIGLAVWLGVDSFNNKHQKDTCRNQTGHCAQNLITTLEVINQHIKEKTLQYMIIQRHRESSL